MKIRKPIITVLGHVDHGKTSFLDAVRGTTLADKEAGRITQHIGATEVPIEVVQKISGDLLKKYGFELKIPGLLFIDTPGHEAFTNLRNRGGSIADLAVLVVDVMQLCQPQTFEALEILKNYKVPFVVALTKLDMLPGWFSKPQEVSKSLLEQNEKVLETLDHKVYTLVGQLHSKGFVSERFDRVNDFTKQIAIIPLSSRTTEGLHEMLMFLSGLSQKFLEKNLNIEESGPGKATILEVKEEKGMGTTVDVILYEGELKINDKIVLAGRKGLIETKIRALLEPKPLTDIRMQSSEKFAHVDEVHAAAGIKICAPGLDGALAGSPLLVEANGNEKELVMEEIKGIEISTQEMGPVVKADTLGSLEAIQKMLKDQLNLTVRRADIGELTKRDVIEANAVREKDSNVGIIFCFHVNILPEVMEEAEKNGVKIFSADVIYQLFDDYGKWVHAKREEEKTKKLENLTMPAKFQVLPNFIFRNNKPAIVGVKILEGALKTNIKVFNESGLLGKLVAIQEKGKNLTQAGKDQEVAVSIDDATVGRNLGEKDFVYSYLTLNTIAALKELNILSENELQLMDEIIQKQQKFQTEEHE